MFMTILYDFPDFLSKRLVNDTNLYADETYIDPININGSLYILIPAQNTFPDWPERMASNLLKSSIEKTMGDNR